MRTLKYRKVKTVKKKTKKGTQTTKAVKKRFTKKKRTATRMGQGGWGKKGQEETPSGPKGRELG